MGFERSTFPVPLPFILLLLLLVTLFVSVPAFPATFAVAPDGNDSNVGDTDAPWRTIQKAASTVQPGDTVEIRPGTYAESVNLLRGGSEDAPVRFAAEPGALLVSPNSSASLEAFDFAPGVGFVTLSGVEATGGFKETIFLRAGVHDIRIEGCDLHHNRSGIVLGGAYNVTVDGCLLHENSSIGMRIAGASHDILITDTDSFLNGVPGLCSASVDGFTSDVVATNVSFVRTRAYDNGGDGFDLKGDFTTMDAVVSDRNACTGMKLRQNITTRNCRVTRNGLTGFTITSLYGNSTVDVTNCTIANNRGLQMNLRNPAAVGTTYAAHLLNNIVAGDFKAVQYTSGVVFSESHNVFFRPAVYTAVLSAARIRNFTDHDINTGLWAQMALQGVGTLAVDPQFVDAANGDFHVDPTSAAVGRGLNLADPSTPINIGAYSEPAGPTNSRPWADAGRSPRARVLRPVLFSAAGSVDPNGDALSYSWDFGDGSAPVVGFQVTHSFAASGKFPVTLSVSDGSLSNSMTIPVIAR